MNWICNYYSVLPPHCTQDSIYYPLWNTDTQWHIWLYRCSIRYTINISLFFYEFRCNVESAGAQIPHSAASSNRLSHYTPVGNKNLRLFLLLSLLVCLICAVNWELASIEVNLMQIITESRSWREWVEHCEVVAVFQKWLWEHELSLVSQLGDQSCINFVFFEDKSMQKIVCLMAQNVIYLEIVPKSWYISYQKSMSHIFVIFGHWEISTTRTKTYVFLKIGEK